MKFLFNTFRFIFVFSILAAFTSCHDNDNTPEQKEAQRTVLIYVSAENNLGSNGYFSSDFSEILRGTQGITNDNLLVFIDEAGASQRPYIVKISSEGKKIVYTFDEDFYASDPDRMKTVMQWTVSHYPAKSYGLCFWGHATGMLTYNDTISTTTPKQAPTATGMHKAYGVDTGADHKGNGSRWINIPTLAKVIESSMPKLDFIFFDCCCMQTVETGYELRNATDYIIASPAEIPGDGAPYDLIVPLLFAPKDQVGRAIVDTYVNYYETEYKNTNVVGLPMSVVRTDAFENLAYATREALLSFAPNYPEGIDTQGAIYYFRDQSYNHAVTPIMYDLRDVMHKNLTPEAFATWDEAYHEAVPYSRMPTDYRELDGKYNDWMTDTNAINIDFSSFHITKEGYGGISMFFPKNEYNNHGPKIANQNTAIYNYQWTKLIDWHTMGW